MLADISYRIRESTIKTMLDLLLILEVFNEKTTPEQLAETHPKIGVVFNHVSRYDEENNGKLQERIDTYKKILLDKASEIYCIVISDDTEIAGKKWADLKKQIASSSNYQQEGWYENLSPFDKNILASLVEAQTRLKSSTEPLK